MTFDLYNTGIYKAVEKAGGVAKLAELLGVKRQGLYPWVRRGFAPASRAVQIEELYGIPREELMDPRLRAVLTGTANEVARTGTVLYQERARSAPKAPAEPPSADDLV